MKKFLLLFAIFLLINSERILAQYSGSFVVQGDLGKYYPVIFQDLSWWSNKATEFEIGRSDIHTDVLWRGSLIAKFRIHTTNYGHGSNFIDADIRQFDPHNEKYFIAGWQDGTNANGDQIVIIWLQGGSTTYYFNSPVNINPVVYDGVQNVLPYQETNGPVVTYKTGIDPYVNSAGTNGETAYYTGASNNYFAGYVGIGTTMPTAGLDVRNGAIHVEAGYNADYSSQGAYTGWNGSGGGGETNFTNNIGGGGTGGFTFDNVSLSNVSTRLMTIYGNGNVGIGTATPGEKLQVNGNIYAVKGGGSTLILANSNYFSSISSIENGGYSDLALGANGTERIRILGSNGNVGIGTADPKGYKLAVAGNAIAESMTVKLQANWPDVVFKKDYSLMPLSDVKTYIDKNQHLPEIPAAAEVEKDGVNLGEMNRLLVKKVEELTLYLIEKDKEIKEMSEKQQDINKQLSEQIKNLQNQLKQQKS